MALRHRDLIPTVIDRENIHVGATKARVIGKPAPLQRRPALDELGNKVHGQKPIVKTKECPTKVVKPVKKEVDPIRADSNLTKQVSIADPDEKTRNEPQMVTEYINDIYEYLRELEVKYPVKENYLEGHQSTPKMRAILVNWIVQVHTTFKLTLETLHLCVAIIDRYLQCNKNIGRETLQLVGTSGLLVACKYEEMYLPDLSDFVYICDDTFSKKQILRMEIDILHKLDFGLGRPGSIHFLRRYSKIAQVKTEEHTLAKYLLELALMEYSLCHVKPSILAAAACCLSLSIFKDVLCPSKVWTPTLEHYTTYKYSDFKAVITDMADLISNSGNSKNQAIRLKYSSSQFDKIADNPKLKGRLVQKLTTKTSIPK